MSGQIGAKKVKDFRSLTVTLAVAFLALSMVVLITASSLEVYSNFQTQQRVVAEQQHFIAQDAANTVKSFVQEKFSVMEAAVSLGSLAISSQEEQRLVLDKLLGLEPAFRQIVLLNAQELDEKLLPTLSNLVPYELAEHVKDDMLSQASQGKTYISPIYIDEVTSEPLVIMAVPVKDVFGDFKGILSAEVNLKFMWDLVGGIKIGSSGLAYVVDRQGSLIAFGDISRVLKQENLIHIEEVSEFANNNGLPPAYEVDSSKGILGNDVVANYVPLGTPDWAVVVELPVQEAYQSVTQGIIRSIFIMLLGLVLAIVFGIYLSRRITKPIIGLRDAAVRIGKGRLDAQIKITSKDEIGELSKAFDEMRLGLKDRNDLLNSLLNAFRGKFGNIATIVLRQNIKELARKNPRIAGILPKSLGMTVRKREPENYE